MAIIFGIKFKYWLLIFIKLHKLLLSLPAKLSYIVLFSFFFGDVLSLNAKISLLTLSVIMKESLVFLLPIIIFFLVFSSFSKLSENFVAFTLILVIGVFISNFIGVMIAAPVGIYSQDFIASSSTITKSHNILEPIFPFELPKICSNYVAIIIGLIFGIYTSIKQNRSLLNFANKGYKIVHIFLNRVFIPILPLFILGFLLKSQHEGSLNILAKNFIPLLLVILILQLGYILSLYFISSNMNVKMTIKRLYNILPASIIGFSCASSAASMPTLIVGTCKNAKDKDIPKRVIPFTINTHMLGDALAIPLMAISLYVVEYAHFPSLKEYIFFAFAYALAKFASAGVPGGTIMIMIPVLESKLGFTGEMSSIILTMYLLFDPLCTMFNVTGNGLFPILFEKILLLLKKKKN